MSATGISNRAEGFTLLEVMVTLVLIGIITGFAVLAIPGGSDQHSGTELRELKALIALHHQEAMLIAEQRGLRFGKTGYAFMTLTTDGDWRVTGQRQLASGLVLTVSVEGRALDLSEDPQGKPQVLLLTSGEMTEFSVQIEGDDRHDVNALSDRRLTGEMTGKLSLEPAP